MLDDMKKLKRFIIMMLVGVVFMAIVIRMVDNTERLNCIAVDPDSGTFAYTYEDGDAHVIECYNKNGVSLFDRRINNPSGGMIDLFYEDGNLNVFLRRENKVWTYNSAGEKISTRQLDESLDIDVWSEWEQDGNTYMYECCGVKYVYAQSMLIQNVIQNKCSLTVSDESGKTTVVWSAE